VSEGGSSRSIVIQPCDVQLPLYDSYRTFCRGRLRTNADGYYAFRSDVKPISHMIPTDGPVGAMLTKMGRHAWRPAHVHAMLSHPDYVGLTTHLFVKGDPYLESDAVFGVKSSLVVEFVEHSAGTTPDGGHCDEPFCVVEYNFVLARSQFLP